MADTFSTDGLAQALPDKDKNEAAQKHEFRDGQNESGHNEPAQAELSQNGQEGDWVAPQAYDYSAMANPPDDQVFD